jgi:hypothetical protein
MRSIILIVIRQTKPVIKTLPLQLNPPNPDPATPPHLPQPLFVPLLPYSNPQVLPKQSLKAGPIAWGIKLGVDLVCDKLSEQIVADFGREESFGLGGGARGVVL